ncbi:MAG: ROK family transcriptional regulator [Candidatus Marinimicrobia bacterium]|nr:ROK family transcriptional regulator [Candidatus Neomarinimicrobiota bacterium]
MNAEQKGRPSYLYHLNQSRIFRLIRSSGKISRNQLARKTGLSIPTISRSLQNLKNLELVVSSGSRESGKKGGRPPQLFHFPATQNYAIGIDLEKETLSCILADMSGKIREFITMETPAGATVENVNQRIMQCIEEMQNKIPSKGLLRGVGLSVPGLVNRQEGILTYSHTFGWKDIPLVSLIRRTTRIPVFLDNEANLLSLGELCFGSGKIYKNFICIDIRYGIGCGIVYQNRLLDIPGELGQICLDDLTGDKKGLPRLTLEDRASDHAVLQKVEAMLQQGTTSSFLNSFTGPLTLDKFKKALQKNDQAAQTIFNQALSDLGIALAFLVNIFHPEAFIFHGPLTENNPSFYTRLREVIDHCSLSPFSATLDLKPACFQNMGGAVGAVALVLQELLNLNPDFFSKS